MIPQQQPPFLVHRCGRCGYDLSGVRVGDNCPECGSPVSVRTTAAYPTNGAAVASLVLGIISIIGCTLYGILAVICGPLAIYFGRKAKLSIEAGHADPNSMGMATAGTVCGIIGTCLGIIAVLIVIAYIALVIFALAGASGRGP